MGAGLPLRSPLTSLGGSNGELRTEGNGPGVLKQQFQWGNRAPLFWVVKIGDGSAEREAREPGQVEIGKLGGLEGDSMRATKCFFCS